MRTRLLSLALAGLWITLSEFLRNEILFKGQWVARYAALGLTFETRPLNGILWTVWSFALAFVLDQLMGRFSFKSAVALTWLAAFVLMWITLFNLQVLPPRLLLAAVPLSLLEVVVAGLVLAKARPRA